MKPQLHVSGLLMLEGCGEQFRRRYIEGHRIAPSAAIHVGNAVDRGVTLDLQRKIDTGELAPDEEIRDAVRDTLNAKWAEDGVTMDPEEDQSEEQARGASIDAAIDLASLHHSTLAPILAPTHVQRPWCIEVSGLPVDLVGTIDIQEGPVSIRDTKTAKKSPPANAADSSLQLTTYALAANVIDGNPPKYLHLDYLVRTPKRGETKVVFLVTTRGPSDWDPFLERVGVATRAMESGIFMPARPDDWRCSEKWFGYWRTCRYALKPVTIQGGVE
jgi:hypothetical protein